MANKKVFRRLIPFLLLMYVIAFLDRSNVSFAQKEFEVDFGISAASYAFGAGLFFVGYALFEVPSNLLLHKVGARWWLARIMVSWGIVAAAFMFVQGPISFYILRFLLGVDGGRLLPRGHPVPHLLDPRPAPEPGPRYFYMGIAIAGIIGNPLSGGLLELNGVFGLRGIQWMFLVEGAAGRRRGHLVLLLPDRQAQGRQVAAGRRAAALVETIAAEDTAKADGHGRRRCLRPWATGGCGTSHWSTSASRSPCTASRSSCPPR